MGKIKKDFPFFFTMTGMLFEMYVVRVFVLDHDFLF